MSINPSFLIKKPVKTTGLCLIYLQAKWSGKRLLYTTGQNIPLNMWDRVKQRAKNNGATTKDGTHYINDLLTNMEGVLLKAYRKESASGIPTVPQIKKYLDDFFKLNTKQEKLEQGKPKLYDLLDSFIKNEILYKGKKKSMSTIGCYKSTLKHLKTFKNKEKYKISFESITLDFFYRFVKYLSDKKIQQNALNKYIGVIKAWMSEAVDLRYTDNMDFRKSKFSIGQKRVETVYLKESEIQQIYKCKLPGNLEQVRDTFVIACYTGFRFSDFSTLKIKNIHEIDGVRYIRKITQKTNEEVILPINPTVIEILLKYNETIKGLPKVPCNQIFNRQVKQICELAGLTEKGRLSESPEKELFNCVSTHTGRRSFATNAYLSGTPIIYIMHLTGHKTEKSFMRYIQLGKLDAAKGFRLFMMDKSKAALKVV